MSKRNGKWLGAIVKWVVAAGLMWWLYNANCEHLGKLTDRAIDPVLIAAAFVTSVVSILLTFLRWRLLVLAQGFAFPLADAFRLGAWGFACNYVGPGALGGDLVKAIWLAKDQTSRRMAAAATVVLDRALGMIMLFVVGAAAAWLPTDLPKRRGMEIAILVLHAGGIAGLAGLALVLQPWFTNSRLIQSLRRLPVVGKPIGEITDSFALYQRQTGSVVGSLVLSAFGHLGVLSAFYLCARGIHPAGEYPGYFAHLMFIPMAELVGVVVPTPGGIGGLEAAVQTSYEWSIAEGADAAMVELFAANGFLTAIAFRVVSVATALTGVAYCMISGGMAGYLAPSLSRNADGLVQVPSAEGASTVGSSSPTTESSA